MTIAKIYNIQIPNYFIVVDIVIDCNIFVEEDEEDYLDDPIRLWDFDEQTVFCGSKNYFRNVTIEDPGYIVNILFDDYKGPPENSKLHLQEITKLRKGVVWSNNNSNLLSKCKTCSIKVVDCHKFPWYYKNKLGFTNYAKNPNREHNVIQLETDKDKDITIIDLTENKDNRIKDVNKKIDMIEADHKKFTTNTLIGGKLTKLTDNILFKPILNIQNKRHTKDPISEEQDPHIIISTKTKIINKDIQNINSKIKSYQNNKNRNHDVGNKLILGSKSFIKNCDNLSQNTINFKAPKLNEAKISNHKNNNGCKRSNKIKDIYTSERISNTKIKIRRGFIKPKELITSKKYYKDVDDKEIFTNLNAIHIEQYNSLKKYNSLTNKKHQDDLENKQKTIKNSSLPFKILPKINILIKKSTTLSEQKIDSDRSNGCSKPLLSAHRIIPHFHENNCLNHSNILYKKNSNTNLPKRSKETFYNFETETQNSLSKYPSTSQRIHDYSINNNGMANINELLKAGVSKISNNQCRNTFKIHTPIIYTVPDTEMILKRSPNASQDIIGKVNNNTSNINCNKIASKFEEESSRYLLPSNCKQPDSHIQNIFSHYR